MAKKRSSARKISTKPTKIYTYGVFKLNKHDNKIIHDELYRANRYRNTLVSIERGRREIYREIRCSLSPQLKELEEQHQQLVQDCKEARAYLSGITKTDPDREGIIFQIRNIKEKQKTNGEILKKERNAVTERFFSEANEKYRNEKEKRILELACKKKPEFNYLLNDCPSWMTEAEFEKAKKAARKSLGANNKEVNRVVSDLFDEFMLSNSFSQEWKDNLQYDNFAQELRKAARKQCGCFSGTYQAVESAAQASFKTSIYMPEFVRFDHTGKVGIQILGNVSVKDMFEKDGSRIQITFNPSPYGNKERKNKKLAKHLLRGGSRAAIAKIFLGGRGDTATYLTVPFIYHRELPEDGVVKWVYIVAKRVGIRSVYELQFTLEADSFRQSAVVAKRDIIAINLGWRRLDDDSVRIATTWDGKITKEIILPAKMYHDEKRARKLLSIADEIFDVTVDLTNKWIKKEKRIQATMTALRSLYDKNGWKFNKNLFNLTTISRWKSHNKLATLTFALLNEYCSEVDIGDLWSKWKEEKFASNPKQDLFIVLPPGDRKTKVKFMQQFFADLSEWFKSQGITDQFQIMALYLEWWRRKDEHLVNWSRGLSLRLRRWRREIYRVQAKKLSEQYNGVVIEKWNKSKTAEVPEPEEDERTKQEENSNKIRQFCGISVFTDALKQKFGKDNVHEELPKNISKEHYKCGGFTKDTKEKRCLLCERCKMLYDQDVNAARQLWARHIERSGGDKTPGTSRKSKKQNNVNNLGDKELRSTS